MSAERVQLHVRKDDQVQVISGKEKGKTGKVLSVNSKTGRVTIEKLNVVKRHVKPSNQNPQGGIIEKETAIHASNVLVMCTKCGKGTRHGVKAVEVTAKKKGAAAASSKKVRVCKRCGTSPDKA